MANGGDQGGKKGFWSGLVDLASAGTRQIVDLASVVVKGKASPGQIIFFGIGVFIIAVIVLGTVLGFQGDANLLIWVLAGLGVILLAVLLVMAGLMRTQTPAGRALPELSHALAEVQQVKQERDALRQSTQRLQDEVRQVQGDFERLRKGIGEVNASCLQIFYQLTGSPRYPEVLEQEAWFVIDEDGSHKGRTETKLRASQHAQQMLVEKFGGDHPVSTIWELCIKGIGDGDRQVVMLPALDTPAEKAVLFFFLPEVAPDGNSVCYSFTWTWPKLWEPLLQKGVDHWRQVVKSIIPIPRMRYHFKLHCKLPRISVKNTGEGGGKRVEPEKPVDDHGFREYIWEMADVKPGAQIVLTLAWE